MRDYLSVKSDDRAFSVARSADDKLCLLCYMVDYMSIWLLFVRGIIWLWILKGSEKVKK